MWGRDHGGMVKRHYVITAAKTNARWTKRTWPRHSSTKPPSQLPAVGKSTSVSRKVPLTNILQPSNQLYNHQTTFRHEQYANTTEFSKHIWDLKRASADYTITWSFSRRAQAYSSKSKSCPLCLFERLCIITADKWYLINRRSELVLTCRHRQKHLLALCNPT